MKDVKQYTLEEIIKICKSRNGCCEIENYYCPLIDGNCMFLTADGDGLIPTEWNID